MALAAAVTTLLLFSVPGLALEPLLLPVSHQWHSKYDGEVKTDRPLIGAGTPFILRTSNTAAKTAAGH